MTVPDVQRLKEQENKKAQTSVGRLNAQQLCVEERAVVKVAIPQARLAAFKTLMTGRAMSALRAGRDFSFAISV
jgi:hypothetical protein